MTDVKVSVYVEKTRTLRLEGEQIVEALKAWAIANHGFSANAVASLDHDGYRDAEFVIKETETPLDS